MTRAPILYLAPNRFDGPRQRTQHLAEGLARSREVIFVEPAVRLHRANVVDWFSSRTAASWQPRYTRLPERLAVFTPGPTLPAGLDLRAINRFIHFRVWRQFQRLVPRVAAGEVDVIVGWPPAVDLATRLRTRSLTYDCLDLYPAFFRGSRHRTMKALEAELVSRACGIVVTSRRLEERWAHRHNRLTIIPNGVELERFGASPGTTAAAELDAYPRPRLGYIGTVGRWLDLRLLGDLARRRPDWSILLVGPLERGVGRLPELPNLHVLGVRPYSSLSAIMAGLDVLLIPFQVTELTQSVNPIKLYEYCATGKPIVSTPLEEVMAHDALCFVGGDTDAFLNAVESALAEVEAPNPALSAARQSLANASTWDKRVADLVQFIDRSP